MLCPPSNSCSLIPSADAVATGREDRLAVYVNDCACFNDYGAATTFAEYFSGAKKVAKATSLRT
jgi:hypothetical protein